MTSILTWVADHLLRRHQQRTEVHLRAHEAFLITDPKQPQCWFLNIYNASPERIVQVTHVWIEAPGGGHIAVMTRQLPVVVQPRGQWETWVEVGALPPGTDMPNAARALLADGTIIESVAREDVPPAGAVPG